MNIIIRDDQGLDTALMMDGYSREQRQNAKQTIRTQFRDTANKVFNSILEMPVPETLVVNMAISNNEELKGECAARLASFNVALSRANSAFFTIREITVKTVLNNEDTSMFKSTVIHEMFHAADKQMLENCHRLFDTIQNDINDGNDSFNKNEENANIALLKTLQVFNHYRAEGVAILGESILMKSKFGTIMHAVEQFCSVFELTMLRAKMRINNNRDDWHVFDNDAFHKAYAVAPIILLLILAKRGDLRHEIAMKALSGLATGNYKLTDDETKAIMRSTMGLTLAGYIQGLTNLGGKVAPIRPFLDFCASLQQEWDEENMSAYEQLIKQPKSEIVFNEAMNQIMGSCISEEELDGLYSKYMGNDTDEPLDLQLKEKLIVLYSILKNDGNPDRKRLAQWALTYLFDDEDIIHDDVSGLGLIDDMTIVDYAITLLHS